MNFRTPTDRDALDSVSRDDLHSFIRRSFRIIDGSAPFSDNWHMEALTHQLERCERGEIRRLIITMPPRHLKSLSASIAFPAWLLGRNPSRKIIAVSYNDTLAAGFSRDTRRVMESDWYARVFPSARLRRATDSELETTAGGLRFATSIGGTLTGRGGNFIIIDDPIKAGDATSAVERAKVTSYYREVLSSRLDDPATGCIILVMQRLHVADLAGYLIENEDWEHLCLPAIAQQAEDIPLKHGRTYHRQIGEPLHAERMPLELLEGIRRTQSSRTFAAQYLQQPEAPDGSLVKRHWLHHYDEPLRKLDYNLIVQSWDLASLSESADYSVGITFGLTKTNIDILNVTRARQELPEIERLISIEHQRWGAYLALIENAGCGRGIFQRLLRAAPTGGHRWVQGIHPANDKATRLETSLTWIENGTLRFPREAPWLPALLEELLSFPGGRHDDQVDALSQFLNWYSLRGPAFTRCYYLPDPHRIFSSFEDRRAFLGPDEDSPRGNNPPAPPLRQWRRSTYYMRNRNSFPIF